MPPKQKPTVTKLVAPVRSASAARGRVGVGLDLREQRLLDVGHVLPVAVALAGARRPAEVVDRDRVMAGLGEPLGELDVEAVEPPDVGQDDHAGAAGAVGRLGQRGGEHRAVG